MKKKRGRILLFVIFLLLATYFTYTSGTYKFFSDAFPVYPAGSISWITPAFIISLLLIAGIHTAYAYHSLKSKKAGDKPGSRSLLTNMSEGYLFCRILTGNKGLPEDCLILEVNKALLDYTGKSKSNIVGKKLSEVFPQMLESDTAQVIYPEEAKTAEIYAALGIASAIGEVAAVGGGYIGQEGTASGLDGLSGITGITNDAAGADNKGVELVRMHGKWFRLSSFVPQKGYIGIMLSDMTEMKKAEETAKRQASYDSLTGFFSRTYFQEAMDELGKSLDGVKPLSFITIDIDGLKITNDTLGHKAGDRLIVEASKIISRAFGTEGIISRIGGDEFCAILPNTDNRSARKKAEGITQLLGSRNSNRRVPISLSLGVSTSDDQVSEDIYDIFRRADDDMYRYKMSQSRSEKSKVIDMLLTALSEKDFVAQGHVERLAELAEHMAEELGLQESEKRDLVLLTRMHDLGKIGIPDDILNKPGRLTKNEFDKMKQHVRIGFNIVNRSKELANIARLILHHHERWDGMGYPDGLKKDAIPLECRILGVLDAYDAMTSERPYHKGISKEEALAEITRCSGTQFDPVIAGKFRKLAGELL